MVEQPVDGLVRVDELLKKQLWTPMNQLTLLQQKKALEHFSKRERKKRRKRRTPRTSSRSLRGRARRRQRQWHAYNSGFPGDVPLRAMLPSVVVWPEMLGIMAGMDQEEQFCSWLVLLVTIHLVLYFLLIVDVRGDSTGAVLLPGDMPVVTTGALGQTAHKTVEIPQLQFLGQGRADFLSWCRGRFPWSRLFVGPKRFHCCWTK